MNNTQLQKFASVRMIPPIATIIMSANIIYATTLVIVLRHYNRDIIMSAMASKSPTSRWFAQTFVRAQIKENIETPRHWPLWGEFTADRWIPHPKASNAENASIWWRHHWTNLYHLSVQHMSYLNSDAERLIMCLHLNLKQKLFTRIRT